MGLITQKRILTSKTVHKSDLFPSLLTGNEEDNNTRSSLYSSQMISMPLGMSQNRLFLSSCWPVWQSDRDEERLPWRQH